MKKISEVLEPMFSGKGAQYFKVTKAYNYAVGEVVSQLTLPLRLDKGVLTIGVNDNMWLAELAHMKEEIINNMKSSGVELTDIKFVYKNFTTGASGYERPGRQPDEKELAYAERMCADLPEGELKNSIKKAMRSYFTMYSKDDFLNC